MRPAGEQVHGHRAGQLPHGAVSTCAAPGLPAAAVVAVAVAVAVADHDRRDGSCCLSSRRWRRVGGAWLLWQGVREHRGWLWIGLGVVALGAYGFVATLQPDANFGRILAAYGGVFVAGSLV